MNFTIASVQQDTLIALKYTVVDAAIIDYLRKLFLAKKMRRTNHKGTYYHYINCQKAVEALPILKLTPETFRRHLTKYVKDGILLRHGEDLPVKDQKIKYHRIYYYRFDRNKEYQLFSHFLSVV